MATKYTIKYVYGSYNGTQDVVLMDDSEEDPIDVFWRDMRPHMSLAMATKSARIISQEHLEEDEDGIKPKRHPSSCACDRCLQREFGSWS